ncbi:hypothetical protein C8R47DRAFT_977208 [Mycena vitilis]|nr:hypothetical protein C8R47DRAFT_977208 [Mycena vitilis]
MKALPTLSSHATHHKVGYYPASLCVLAVWIVFIIVLLWLLESAVTHGPQNLSQPWAYSTLPSLLITVFAQGHGAITAMHLARVSVSALHSVRTSPNTWAEMFWMSDRAWSGPVGILSTFLAASRLRVRTSTHFLLCAATCLVALATPIVLSRAYPIRTVTVNENTMITPLALSVPTMGAVDAYAEIGTGSGSWTTSLSVTDTYNSSVYLPPGVSRGGDPVDFFFAGSVEGKTARLPGLRLTGQCTPISSSLSSFEDLEAYCQAQIPNLPFASVPTTLTPTGGNFTMRSCCNSTWQTIFPANSSSTTNVGYIYIQSNNHTATGSSGLDVSGLIRCDTKTSTGSATLSGADGTFSDFQEGSLYNQTNGGEPLLDPLYALFYYFDNGGRTHLFTDNALTAGTVHALGFVSLSNGDGLQSYTQPSLQEMAAGFWRGVSYTVAGLGLLSRASDKSYPAVQSGQAAVYVRERKFAIPAYILLGVWLLLLILITARSFRPTIGSSFDSYTTAKLIMEKPGLLETTSGDLAANKNLREPFSRIGRDERGRVMVADHED